MEGITSKGMIDGSLRFQYYKLMVLELGKFDLTTPWLAKVSKSFKEKIGIGQPQVQVTLICSSAVTLVQINAFLTKKKKKTQTCNAQVNANHEHSHLETSKVREVYKYKNMKCN